MSGVQFVVDERGVRTAAVIDLKEHSQLWEDFYDALVTKERMEEPRETLQSVRKRIRSRSRLNG